MGVELLAEGRISSVFLDDVYYVAAEQLPAYVSLSARPRSGTRRPGRWHCLRGADVLGAGGLLEMDRESVGKLLRSLEAKNLVGRVAYNRGRFSYRSRTIERMPRQKAVDSALLKHLDLWAPATADEAAFALHLPEPEVATALKQMTEDGLLEEGRFIVGEREQYMLKRDHLRLKHGAEVFDHRTVDGYQRSKLERKFGSIEECIRFFGEMGLLYDIWRRVEDFSLDEWRYLRESGGCSAGASCAAGCATCWRRMRPCT
jgi:ATP-dependent Lhr-like helicase